jgi:hypothetical protein
MNDHTEIPVLGALRDELVDGVRRSAERRSPNVRVRRVAAVGMAGAAVAASVSLVLAFGPTGTSGPPPAAAFSLQVEEDGRIHVTMHQDFDQADRLADELRAAGVDVRVLPHPAHPVLVGTVEFPSHQLDDDGAVGVEEGDREFWIDPRRFDGEIEMLVYVEPEPGEDWEQSLSVFHPDEPLGGLPCVLDGPLTTEELQARARSVGIDDFRWITWDSNPALGSASGDRAETSGTEPAPAGEVWEAHRVGPDHLQVGVLPPEVVAESGPTAPPSMNLNVGEAPEPECTPELRARWDDQ